MDILDDIMCEGYFDEYVENKNHDLDEMEEYHEIEKE